MGELLDIGLDEEFLDMTPKVEAIKQKHVGLQS